MARQTAVRFNQRLKVLVRTDAPDVEDEATSPRQTTAADQGRGVTGARKGTEHRVLRLEDHANPISGQLETLDDPVAGVFRDGEDEARLPHGHGQLRAPE